MDLKLVRKPNDSATPRTSKENIVEAALRCFKQYGPQRTSMADIAEEAGVSRKTLYRVFEDRAALVENILDQRLMKIFRNHKKELAKFQDLEEALIEGSILAVAGARTDKLFNDIIQKDTNRRVEQQLLSLNAMARQRLVAVWTPLIDRARTQGLVRKHLTNERIVELLGSIHTVLLIRDDFSKADQRAFLQDVLVPAIMKD